MFKVLPRLSCAFSGECFNNHFPSCLSFGRRRFLGMPCKEFRYLCGIGGLLWREQGKFWCRTSRLFKFSFPSALWIFFFGTSISCCSSDGDKGGVLKEINYQTLRIQIELFQGEKFLFFHGKWNLHKDQNCFELCLYLFPVVSEFRTYTRAQLCQWKEK